MKSVSSVQSLSVNFLTLEHVPAWQIFAADPSFAAIMEIAPPVSAETIRRSVERKIAERIGGRSHISMIKNRDEVVGFFEWRGLAEKKTSELICWIAPEFRGRGFGTFGVKQALELVFKNFGLARVRWLVRATDVAARHVAGKNGFQTIQPTELAPRDESSTVYEITRTQWLDFSQAPALARLPSVLKDILQAELGAGNEVLETGGGWPDPASVFVKLRFRFRTRPDPLPDGVAYTEPKSPHWWTADYSTVSPAHILACGDA